MSETTFAKIRRVLFARCAGVIHLFLEQALRDKATYDWLIHVMGNRVAMDERTISDVFPPGLDSVTGFEDCTWLYSSNPLNHGVSRLTFDEAGYLFKLVRSMASPKVVEIGRYKGGTALLIAAAGGKVISLDNGQIPGQKGFTDALNVALDTLGLRDNSQAIIADALTYQVSAESCDLVILDNGLDDFAMGRKFFEYWWPAVRPGGYFLFRDGKDTVLRETARFVSTISPDAIDGTINSNLPGAFVLCHKSIRPDAPVG